MSQLRERSLKLYNKDHQIPAHKSNELSLYEKQLQLLKDIEKKNREAIEQCHVCPQPTKKAYYPAASENAEDRRKKRRKEENKRKSKKRKQEILLRNSQALASLITGSVAEDRFSVPNPSKIRKAELTVLNTNTITLTPRKHCEPLKYLLENYFFHEDARECILSILSVVEVRKVQTKASAKHEKCSKTPKNFLTGQKALFDIFQAKKIRG